MWAIYTGAADATTILQGFSGLYRIIRGVGLACAIVSLAMTAALMIFENDQGAAKAKKAAVYICLAVAAMYIIPLAVSIGANIGTGNPWTPPAPNI